MQPVSAFMQVPKDWMLDDRVRVLSALAQIRFQAMKPYAGASEAINVSEDNAPMVGTLQANVQTALATLKHFGSGMQLISSRSSFVCAGTRPAWRLHYDLTVGVMHLDMLQYIAQAPNGAFDAATYARPGGSAADPEALAAIGTFCPQNFVAPPAMPDISLMPGVRAPLPAGWLAAGPGEGLIPGSHVLGSASKKFADGTVESYLVGSLSLPKFGDVTGKALPLQTVAQVAANDIIQMFPKSKLVSSEKVLGCNGSESQWQFEIKTPLSYLVERLAEEKGQVIVAVYARPIAMAKPDPLAQTALSALCLAPAVASIQQP